MWLMSVACCQSNDTVIYHRSVDTWTWAPPVANAPIYTHIKVADTFKGSTYKITDIQLRKHSCTSQFCYMADETNLHAKLAASCK